MTVAQKLKPYFQAHTIVILMDKPLKRAMSSPKVAGRMALWVVELSEFDIRYCPRTAIKGQVVAGFTTEFTLMKGLGAKVVLQWNVHTDRSSNKQAGGTGVIFHTLEGDKIECMIRLDFPMTNNEAEYETLVVGLDLTRVAGIENMVVYYDPQVVTSQINGDYECKNKGMKKYLEVVKGQIGSLQIRFIQIPKGVERMCQLTS